MASAGVSTLKSSFLPSRWWRWRMSAWPPPWPAPRPRPRPGAGRPADPGLVGRPAHVGGQRQKRLLVLVGAGQVAALGFHHPHHAEPRAEHLDLAPQGLLGSAEQPHRNGVAPHHHTLHARPLGRGEETPMGGLEAADLGVVRPGAHHLRGDGDPSGADGHVSGEVRGQGHGPGHPGRQGARVLHGEGALHGLAARAPAAMGETHLPGHHGEQSGASFFGPQPPAALSMASETCWTPLNDNAQEHTPSMASSARTCARKETKARS
jgi:hypothetical protein